jgi:uncharacterized protein
MDKYENLISILKSYGNIAVAFSGGVDSTFLLYAARQALGDRVLAITASSGLFPKREMKESLEFCEELGVKHVVLEVDELGVPGFAENPKDRCYICKKDLFTKLIKTASDNGIQNLAEGSNTDDMGDYRPGLRAIKELGVMSPLREAQLSKDDVRKLSKEFGLKTWDKPSFACLASRFVYGEHITKDKLKMVEEAEELLRSRGFKQFRVRIHGDSSFLARIELLGEDLSKVMSDELREEINRKLKEIGFVYVTLDLGGYRMGSMNVEV